MATYADYTQQGKPDPYRQQVNDALMPYWEQARNSLKANLADQGILSSTGGMKRYANQEQQFAQAANTMYADLQKQARAEQFQQQQANISNAQNLYNLLWSAYLNQWQLKGTDKGLRAPQDFPIFSNIFNAAYQQPLSTYLPKNTGDANTEQVPRYSPNQGDTMALRNQKADEAYRNAYLAYQKERDAVMDARYAAEHAGAAEGTYKVGDWSGMTEYALALESNGFTPAQAAQAALLKYGTAIKPYLDENHGGALAFLKTVFGDDAEGLAAWMAENKSPAYKAQAAVGVNTKPTGFANSPYMALNPVGQIGQLIGDYPNAYYNKPQSTMGKIAVSLGKFIDPTLRKLFGY